MFVSDQIVFIELQKTGSTHVRHLLTGLLGGSLKGKHNAPTPEILARGTPILGSVRNPWSWYVSLWTYGCQKKGVLYQRLIDPAKWPGTAQAAAHEGDADDDEDDSPAVAAPAGKKGQGGKRKGQKKPGGPLPALASAARARDFWYADPGNPEAFREWLTLVLSPAARRIVESGYRRNPISRCGGLMTYRYFKLFVRDTDQLTPDYKTVPMLVKLDQERCWVKHFIQSERLEDDFIRAMTACGVALSEEQLNEIRTSRKRNVSERPLPTEAYYDAATLQLVADRERFIIEKFGYRAPSLPVPAAA